MYLDIVFAQPRHVSHKSIVLRCLLNVDREPHVVAGLLGPLLE